MDIPAIAEAAAKYQVALELNNSSFTHSRPGSEANCRAIAAAVKAAGGMLSFGSDSHTAFTLGNFDHCLRIAREVDFPEERVLNVTPRRLLDFLELHTGKQIAELADF
ncbi:histidinol phosphatase-like PHP family hydrolase [Pantoea alhagi]|nr:histidinol phosphatase-like PHP family hydrolase [Pantoea alhagi]